MNGWSFVVNTGQYTIVPWILWPCNALHKISSFRGWHVMSSLLVPALCKFGSFSNHDCQEGHMNCGKGKWLDQKWTKNTISNIFNIIQHDLLGKWGNIPMEKFNISYWFPFFPQMPNTFRVDFFCHEESFTSLWIRPSRGGAITFPLGTPWRLVPIPKKYYQRTPFVSC